VLADELMGARRAVKAAKRSSDPSAIAQARRRVDDAKVALGERRPKWWTPQTAKRSTPPQLDRITSAAFHKKQHRMFEVVVTP